LKRLLIISLIIIFLPNNSFSQISKYKIEEIINDIAELKEGQEDIKEEINTRIYELDRSIKDRVGGLRNITLNWVCDNIYRYIDIIRDCNF
jgi:hypothetical protein